MENQHPSEKTEEEDKKESKKEVEGEDVHVTPDDVNDETTLETDEDSQFLNFLKNIPFSDQQTDQPIDQPTDDINLEEREKLFSSELEELVKKEEKEMAKIEKEIEKTEEVTVIEKPKNDTEQIFNLKIQSDVLSENFVENNVKETPAVDKLFKKAIEMEDDLEVLRRKFEEVKSQKKSLEVQIEKKDRVIFDTSSKLEEAMTKMQNLRTSIDQRENELRNIQRENRMLSDYTHMNLLTKERLERLSTEGVRRVHRPLSTDRMAKLVKLEDDLKLKKKMIGDLHKEIVVVKKQIGTKNKAILTLENEIKKHKTNEEKAYHVECRNSELQYQVDTLKKEIRTLQQITRMKTQTIQQLNVQIESWKHLEEAYKDLQKQMKTKQKEVKSLLFKLNNLKKENSEKEKHIEDVVRERDDYPVKCLEQDKVYLKKQLKNSVNKRYELEKTIKSQEKMILMLRKRMDQLNIALKETKIGKLVLKKRRVKKMKPIDKDSLNVTIDPTKFIQKNLYLLMKKDAEMLRTKKKNLKLLLNEKNSAVEALNMKIESFKKTKEMEEKLQKERIKEVKKKTKKLQNQLKESEIVFKRKEMKMKQEILSLKKRLIKARERKKLQRVALK